MLWGAEEEEEADTYLKQCVRQVYAMYAASSAMWTTWGENIKLRRRDCDSLTASRRSSGGCKCARELKFTDTTEVDEVVKVNMDNT